MHTLNTLNTLSAHTHTPSGAGGGTNQITALPNITYLLALTPNHKRSELEQPNMQTCCKHSERRVLGPTTLQ
eukprot:11926811-Alexandrium_andersonii.AAC.1